MGKKCKNFAICGNYKPPISKVSGLCDECALKYMQNKENTYPKKYFKETKESNNRRIKSISLFREFGSNVWELNRNKKTGIVYCSETSKPLCNPFDPFDAKKGHGMCVSHILSKSSHPKLYLVLENADILCWDAHQKFEYGDKKSMKIWNKYEPIIEKLLRFDRFLKKFQIDCKDKIISMSDFKNFK